MAATLTSIAINTRRVIRYSIFFVIFLIVARGMVGAGISIYKKLVPKPPPPPTVQFGRLPSLPFPKPTQEYPQIEYTLETVSGGLPTFSNQANVYLMPPYTTTLFSADEAKKKANSLGFESEPIQLSSILYRYANTVVPSTLELNIVNGAFSVSYNLAADQSPLATLPPNETTAVSLARQILKSSGALNIDLDGEPKHEFLKVEGQNLVRALSLSEASLIRVSLRRHDVDKLPAVTADPTTSNAWFIISGAQQSERQLIAAQFRHFQLDEKRSETYPIKTANQAYEELVAGKGYIANLGLNQNGKVTLREVYLAYYDPDVVTPFYQPVIVFKGDGDFFAYVPAIVSDFYGEVSN